MGMDAVSRHRISHPPSPGDLTPEERRVHQLLSEAREGLDAARLAEASGLERLRLYRVLDALRLRGLVETYPGSPVLFYASEGPPRPAARAVPVAVEAPSPRTLEPGLYLVQEPRPERSLRLYRDLAADRGGERTALLLSRERHDGPGTRLRLGSAGPGPRVERLDEVVRAVRQAGPGAVVLLDGLEYLVTRHGFDAVLRMVHHLREVVALLGSVLLMAVDPRTLEPKQMALLEREARTL